MPSAPEKRYIMGLWAKKDDMPLELRLLVGSTKEREEEARKQGITECWETAARRDATTTRKPSTITIGGVECACDDDGTVRAWCDVAGFWTIRHGMTETQQDRVRRSVRWGAI